MNVFPSSGSVYAFPLMHGIETGTSASITSEGSITMTVTPSVGFQIKLEAFGEQLVNTKAVASFTNALTLQVGASTSGCPGAWYGIDYGVGVNIDLQDPLPGWISGNQHISVYSHTATIRGMRCYLWSSSSVEKRLIESGSNYFLHNETIAYPSNPLVKRIDENDVLFPDPTGSSISCSNNINTPTGNCHVKIADYGSDPTDGGAIGRRGVSTEPDIEAPPDMQPRNLSDLFGEVKTYHELVKRGRKGIFSICKGIAVIDVLGPDYPSSGDMLRDRADHPFLTYGPTNPSDCDDYGIDTSANIHYVV